MNVLVATREGQGKRRNDFAFTTDEELVELAFECDGEAVDGSCGCRRSFAGIDSHKATTTAKVVEVPLRPDQYLDLLVASSARAGWNFTREDLEPSARDLLRIAAGFPVGAVVEKRGDAIQVRA